MTAPDRVTVDLREHELREAENNRKWDIAQDEARKKLNSEDFDSEVVREAMIQDREWWSILIEELANDPSAAGRKLREAVFDELTKRCFSDL